MRINRILLMGLVLLAGQSLMAHGEDRPGPNGGYIRMPGAFHTELVPVSESQFKVYLLDINFQNPSIKDSKLEVSVGGEKAKCKVQDDFYLCDIPKGKNLQEGEVVVKAQREKQRGNEIAYQLPLSYNFSGESAHNHGQGGGHDHGGGHGQGHGGMMAAMHKKMQERMKNMGQGGGCH